MAKLFLSYSRKDAPLAKRFTQWLEQRGHDVWRDEDDIRGGASFSLEIERALKDCDAVLVLWSVNSVQSAWVRDEAGFGRDAGKLIPFSLDETDPPLGFRQLQSIALPSWKNRGGPSNVEQINRAIAGTLGSENICNVSARDSAIRSRALGVGASWLKLTAVALGLLVTAFGVHWWIDRSNDRVIAIAVSPSPTSTDRATASDFANMAAADMAAILPTHFDQVTVITPADAVELTSGYRVLIAANQHGAGSDASLTLSDADGHTILWSKSWSGDQAVGADLRQQVSRFASRAALCLAEARAGKQRLVQPALGIFVSGCVGIDASDWSDSELLATFERVVKLAPSFARGWEYLAIGRSVAASSDRNPEAVGKARDAIAGARRLKPDSGLAYFAEALLIPDDHIRALRLLEKGASLAPDEPLVQTQRSDLLKSVGRMVDSVQAAKRAVELDPLSPLIRANYVSSLAYAGQFSRAQNEIIEARKKWLYDSQIDAAEFSYQFRYGDPRAAEKLMTRVLDYSDAQLVPYRDVISARLDPTPTKINAAVRDWNRPGQGPGRNRQLLALGLFGRVDDVYALLADPSFQPFVDPSILFRPEFAAVRADRRFMSFAARLGLTRYWTTSGKWPDFCRAEKLRYDCKVAAQHDPG